jgi:hypothetical protein
VTPEKVEDPAAVEKETASALTASAGDTPLLGEVPVDPVIRQAPKNIKKNEDKNVDAEDDLGIIQPEFGF